MTGTHDFLQALATVLCVAAVTTVVFQRLKQPVVLGYLIAGLIIGPHLPIPLVADAGVVHTLSELGVILLMFSLGLEFSIRKLLRVGPVAGLTALIQSSIMIWLGFVVGRAFGWSTRESLFCGAMIAISSTTIIAKAFDEQGIKGRLRELVVGVLIVEDLIAILLMALLTGIASGEELTGTALLSMSGRLLLFLVALVVVGLFVAPRAIRFVVRLERPETTLVASVGLCFAVALLAQSFGYSVALGAFIAGSLVSESGEAETVEHLVHPVRDMFAAVFFVSVGMLLDPKLVAEHWVAVTVLCVVVVVGKVFGVTLGAFLTGNGTRTSVQAGMSLAQIGEFSFIIAGLGLSLKATGDFIYPVAVAVSAFTTLTTPWLIRASGPVASFVDRKLPRPLQTFASLYASWLESLRVARVQRRSRTGVGRAMLLLCLDAALLAAVLIVAGLYERDISQWVSGYTGLPDRWLSVATTVGAFILASPFALGIVRLARRIGRALAATAIPAGGRVDLGLAPRRALEVALELAVVVAVGLPLVAVTQPFISGAPGAALLGVTVLVVSLGFWRTASELQGHVRAGAEVIAEALSAQSMGDAPAQKTDPLAKVGSVLSGLGEPRTVTLLATSPSVGQTLAQLDVRGLTGASVLAVSHPEEAVTIPTAQYRLRAGDRLAVAGSSGAVDAAATLLLGSPAVPAPLVPPVAPAAPETVLAPSDDGARGVAAYLLITFALAWLPAWLLRDAWHSAGESGVASRLWTTALLYAVTMGWQPLLAVWVVRRFVDGPGYLNQGHQPAPRRFVWLALFAPIALVLVAALVGSQLGVHIAPERALPNPESVGALAFGMVALWTLLWTQTFSEELGWRGYFLTRMMQRHGPWRGLVTHGLVWGLWYAPIFLLAYGDLAQSTEHAAGMVLTCTLLGTMLGWLRLASKSIIPAVLANGVLTLAAGLPFVLRGIDVGARSAVFGPAGWLLMFTVVLALALSSTRRAVTMPTDAAAPQARRTPIVVLGNLLGLERGRLPN